MCLLTVASRVHPDSPLIVAANRDEWLERDADAMVVLQEREPRILGGRDRVAGGTWLAVSEHGVVAGLTNKPSTDKDPAKRSRGELPLLLARQKSAAAAAEAFADQVDVSEYNPCWLLVGDRETLYYLDATGTAPLGPRPLGPGVHVLENRALRAPSPKAAWVSSQLVGMHNWRGEALVARLHGLLRSHEIPAATGERPDDERWRPVETEAACVHAGPYGTRSSSIVILPPTPDPPRLWYSAGPPCTAELENATSHWLAA
jgi:uncharacterized protein with NRDE domain